MTERQRQAIKIHGAHVDNAVNRFSLELAAVVAIAQSSLANWLMTHLKLDADHKVLPTLSNQKILRSLPALWQSALDDAGLPRVIQHFTEQFPHQIEAFRTVLEAAIQSSNQALPAIKFTKSDKKFLDTVTLAVAADLTRQMTVAMHGMVVRSALSSGGLQFKSLVDQIGKAANVAKARAESGADTGIQGFYRLVAGKGYDKMQGKLLSSVDLTYRYQNPRDQVTRPWCLAMLNRKDSLTKKEIQKLEPGPGGLEPWHFCGGHRCRGEWVLDVSEFLTKWRASARTETAFAST